MRNAVPRNRSNIFIIRIADRSLPPGGEGKLQAVCAPATDEGEIGERTFLGETADEGETGECTL